jgi:SAM-dependent methyltransferase
MRAMTFNVAASAYDAFMGRFSRLLAGQMADLAAVHRGDRAVDVGCGPGALTTELVARLGADHVAAVDPSEPFVTAARERLPGVDVRLASAELLPFTDRVFDAALAQLVVHFMTDAVAGIREMARVTRPGGAVVACVWDHAGGAGPLGLFWTVAREMDPSITDESDLPGAREGHLASLFRTAGLDDVRSSSLVADLEMPDFDTWWEPFTRGVGPAGSYLARLDDAARAELRDRCRSRLPSGAFVIPARAWAAQGTVTAGG